jgi:hypothetical protein
MCWTPFESEFSASKPHSVSELTDGHHFEAGSRVYVLPLPLSTACHSSSNWRTMPRMSEIYSSSTSTSSLNSNLSGCVLFHTIWCGHVLRIYQESQYKMIIGNEENPIDAGNNRTLELKDPSRSVEYGKILAL